MELVKERNHHRWVETHTHTHAYIQFEAWDLAKKEITIDGALLGANVHTGKQVRRCRWRGLDCVAQILVMYVCMYVGMHVCVYVHTGKQVRRCRWRGLDCVAQILVMHVCISVCFSVFLYVCMHVCILEAGA
jgi:hypothetical protein